MTFEQTALTLAWVAIAILALALSGLLRQVRLLQQPDLAQLGTIGPRVGQPLPNLDGFDATTGSVRLLFVDEACPICHRIVPQILSSGLGADGHTPWVLVSAGNISWLQASESAERAHLLEHQQAAFDDLAIPVTPFGVLADEGRVTAASAIGSIEAAVELFGTRSGGET